MRIQVNDKYPVENNIQVKRMHEKQDIKVEKILKIL